MKGTTVAARSRQMPIVDEIQSFFDDSIDAMTPRQLQEFERESKKIMDASMSRVRKPGVASIVNSKAMNLKE